MSFKKRVTKSIALALVGVTIAIPMLNTASAMENSKETYSQKIERVSKSFEDFVYLEDNQYKLDISVSELSESSKSDFYIYNDYINLLNNIFQEYLKQEKDKSDLIVIYLDKSQDIFKLFKIEFYLENGECRYRIINNSNSIIIGSGSAICNGGSSEFILNIYNDAKKNGCDLTTAISAVIFNIKGKLEDLQSNVYCSTGISPVFHYAIIEGSTFELQELEIKGINLDKNKKINFFDYSIECNDDYDLIEFKDRINNNETKVEKIHKNVDYNTNKKFDPEKREE